MNEELEGDGTGLVSSGCLEVLGRRGGRCVVGSVAEDMREGENERGMETWCARTNLQRGWELEHMVMDD